MEHTQDNERWMGSIVMVKVFVNLIMDEYMKDNGDIVKDMDGGNLYYQTE